ncbi:MAG: alpha/beta hydrolase [Microcoleus vaginatus WJT46-NPBG5]|nr:alpha/beta hydrolase [Microcoleus vaginatus WJT46-NPBG5]
MNLAPFKILALLLSAIGLFLSAWIVVPAPTLLLLPLGVGTPEISPWLLGLNLLAVSVSWVGIRSSRLHRLALGTSLIALLLSILPLAQVPATEQRMNAAMQDALGENYLSQIPNEAQIRMRPQPFSLADTFTGIHPPQVRHTPNIQFAAPDGVPLKMDLYQPPQVGKYPALVVIYGGAWQQGNPKLYASLSRYMATQGYSVFAIDYRHAPRYRFPAQLQDVQAALAFIREHATEYEADAERMALLGGSSGAHLGMLAAYQPSAVPVRAVVNYFGPVNLANGYANPPNPDPLNIRAILESFLGGSPEEVPQLYRAASPITYATQTQPPTLLVYASRDHVIQARYGRQMYERLREAGNTAIFLEIPWAEHAFNAIFQGPSNQLTLYYTERFLAWALRETP